MLNNCEDQQQSSSSCHLIVKDDQQNRRFKVKFRSRDEFFSVTVSKLRRAISTVLEKTGVSHSLIGPSAFSLDFEHQEEVDDDDEHNDNIDNFKITRLPEGQLADHALISDWGLRPGDVVSLVTKKGANAHNHSNNTSAGMMGLSSEEDTTRRAYNDNNSNAQHSSQYPPPPVIKHLHQFESIEDLNNSNSITAANFLHHQQQQQRGSIPLPPANLLLDSSTVSSLAKLSAIHGPQSSAAPTPHPKSIIGGGSDHQQHQRQSNNNNNNNNNNNILLATSQQLRSKIEKQQTTFFLSDNLTPAQKELQLRWMSELTGDDEGDSSHRQEKEEQQKDQKNIIFNNNITNNNHQYNSNNNSHNSIMATTTDELPPTYGNRRSVSSAFSSAASTNHYDKLLEYSADRRREAENAHAAETTTSSFSPPNLNATATIGVRGRSQAASASSVSSSPARRRSSSPKNEQLDHDGSSSMPSLDYLRKKYSHSQKEEEDHGEENPQVVQVDLTTKGKLKTSNNSSSSSSLSSSTSEEENDSHQHQQNQNPITLAIRDADRRENIRLKEQLTLLSAELDVWKDRAHCSYQSLDQKLQHHFSSSSYKSPDERRALADALINAELLQKKLHRREKELSSAKSALEEEKRIRRGMQHDLELLRGNIRVIVRIRGGDGAGNNNNNSSSVINIQGDHSMISLNRGLLKPRGDFEFYKVMPAPTTQADFFDLEIAPLIDVSFASKRNLSLLLFGQTGAGKSYSAFGPSLSSNSSNIKNYHHRKHRTPNIFGEDDVLEIEADRERERTMGVTFRTAKMLLELVEGANREQEKNKSHHPHINNNNNSTNNNRFEVGLSVLELYCDEIRDLLGNNTVIDESISNNTNTNHGASIAIFRSEEEVFQLIYRAARERWTESTSSNAHSSRSHCLLTFSVFQRNSSNSNKNNTQQQQQQLFKIVIADLAGSERLNRSQSTGQRLTEAQFINKSLSALGDVVHALTQPQPTKKSESGYLSNRTKPFIPYRNSPLTMLLQDSLNGDATTLFIACVVDDEAQVEETYSTLTFASRVRCIKNIQYCKGEIGGANNIINKNTSSSTTSSRRVSPSASHNTSRSSSAVNNNTIIKIPKHQGAFSSSSTTTTGMMMTTKSNDPVQMSSEEINNNNDDQSSLLRVDESSEITKSSSSAQYQPRKALSVKSENRSNQSCVPLHKDSTAVKLMTKKDEPKSTDYDDDELEIIDDYHQLRTSSATTAKREKASKPINFAMIQQSGHLSQKETARLRNLLSRK